MNEQILAYVEQTYGCRSDAAYYHQVGIWRDWWKGCYPPFHLYPTMDGQTQSHVRRSLCMAKRVCEDWAAMLFHDALRIAVADPSSSVFLQGDGSQTGILGENEFWTKGRTLLEQALCTGRGAVVLHLRNPSLSQDHVIQPSSDCQIELGYYAADQIIPMSWEEGKLREAAFYSEFVEQGNGFGRLEVHTVNQKGCYQVDNVFFALLDETLERIDPPAGIVATMDTGSVRPLFTELLPGTANAADSDIGLGPSILANALDCLEGVDLAYHTYCCDLQLGGKKVFVNQALIAQQGAADFAPDEMGQQIFCTSTGVEQQTGCLLQEHNPALRAAENTQNIQTQLACLSISVGLGPDFYRFTAGASDANGAVNLQCAAAHAGSLRDMLVRMSRSILWAGCNALGAEVDPGADIRVIGETVRPANGIWERRQDLQAVYAGVLQRWEYRMKWYGESEQTAKNALSDTGASAPA